MRLRLPVPWSRTGAVAARAAVLSVAVFVLSGCSIFGSKDDDEELEPLELVDFEETLDVRRVWSEKLGDGSEALRVGLNPSSDGNRVYAASYDGNVVALDPADGDRVWRTELDIILSAGPGVGGGTVAVAGYDGELVAFGLEGGVEQIDPDLEFVGVAQPGRQRVDQSAGQQGPDLG